MLNLRFPLRTAAAALSTLAVLPCAAFAALPNYQEGVPTSLIRNGGFEQDTQEWAWMTANGARATGALDSQEKRTGRQSYRLSSESDQSPNVYGRLYRNVYGLRPFTTYRIRVWAKGRGVGNAWIGGGPGWYLRQHFPEGDFDWQQIETEYSTGAEAGAFELMVLVESRTQALWVDDIEMVEVSADEARRTQAEQATQTTWESENAHLARLRQRVTADASLQEDRYVALGLNVAARYLERVRQPASEQRQGGEWSRLQIEEVCQVLDTTEQYIAQRGARGAANVSPPGGKRGAFRDGIFTTEKNRPYFFGGYGHFDSVARDVPQFPGLGASLVQQERGPSVILGADGVPLAEEKRSLVETLQNAGRSHIKVDLLLSPHYFPEWAVQKAPEVRNGNPGFIGYNIDHPIARSVIERHLRTLLPAVKNEPALFSLCLSNEPIYASSGRDPQSLPLWTRYLREKHKTVAAVNALYGTHYARLEDVPVPPLGMPQETGAQRAYYDWVRFNQAHFADWHRWIGDLAHKEAPGVPTHAKIMVFNTFERSLLHFGVDPELFCEATDIAGCDAYAFFRSDLQSRFERDAPPATKSASPALRDDYLYSWASQEMFYDLLHSFRGQPVFNSENHLIPDGSPAQHIPPQHTRAALWQGALHHQGATTIWVWEELSDPSLAGSIYFRPVNVHAAGRALLDLNHLSEEVATINRQAPQVALLYSQPSIFWQPDYGAQVGRLYTALTFLGQQVTFVSERQLQSGRYANIPLIIVPHATNVADTTVTALDRFARRGGKVLPVGADCLSRDEYNRARSLPASLASLAPVALTGSDLLQTLEAALGKTNASPRLRFAGGAADSLTWGIEYRAVRQGKRWLVPLINLLPETQTVRLELPPGAQTATDLLSGEKIDLNSIRLPALEPRLLSIEPGR